MVMETEKEKPVKPQSKRGSAKDTKLKQKSAAEFFADNKNIAGFDNPGKSLYTTVRELVENALDSAEAIGQLPEIELTIEEVSRAEYGALVGLGSHERVDEALYDDFETEKAKERRVAKEQKETERQAKALAAGRKVKEGAAKGAAPRGRGEAQIYRATCKDNGQGMPHGDIPNMFGVVLSGTKYGLKQTRGKFGLGAKMALIWSKMSTGLPIEIWSATGGQSFVSYCKLDIDMHKNVPSVFVHEKRGNPDGWRGAELRVVIEGNWTSYRARVIQYMRQMAVISPYAQFTFRFIGASADKNLTIRFARRTDVMPPVPAETKFHPSAVDLMRLKRLVAETSRASLRPFLCHDFDSISKAHADRLIGELGPGFDAKMPVGSLTEQQLLRIHQLFRQAKFSDPSGECLSPAGEYNLRLGIVKELRPDMVATFQSSAHVFEGHPFIVEAAVSLGGKDVKPGINVFRFGNRIPLLFEAGGDVVMRTATKRINWSAYKINQALDRVGVFVSVVSTKIPFKGTGKEFIGDDVKEYASAIKSALQQCCLQLKAKIMRQQQARERQQRKHNLVKYVPDVARAVFDLLLTVAEERDAKRRKSGPERELLERVDREEVTEATLKQKLLQHVEQVDMEMALEYVMQAGLTEAARELLYLRPLDPGRLHASELHSDVCVLKLYAV